MTGIGRVRRSRPLGHVVPGRRGPHLTPMASGIAAAVAINSRQIAVMPKQSRAENGTGPFFIT